MRAAAVSVDMVFSLEMRTLACKFGLLFHSVFGASIFQSAIFPIPDVQTPLFLTIHVNQLSFLARMLLGSLFDTPHSTF